MHEISNPALEFVEFLLQRLPFRALFAHRGLVLFRQVVLAWLSACVFARLIAYLGMIQFPWLLVGALGFIHRV